MRSELNETLWSWLKVSLAVLSICFTAVGIASAQEAQEAPAGAASASTGIDLGSAYFFRGIIQETEGVIAQPYLEASLTVHEADSGLQSVAVTAGTWSSLHSGPSGTDGASGDPKMWYESDFYASVGLGFADAWSTDVTYTAYMSPNQSFGTVKEMSVGVAYDGLLSPSATLAVELDGQADGGLNEGTYLELGIEPGMAFPNSAAGISFPVAVGLSLKDYYEADTSNTTFGFFSVGTMLSVPLTRIPARYGSWELTGGVNFLMFGDALKAINGSDDDVKPIGMLGISLGY
jgi:hypothetical protein